MKIKQRPEDFVVREGYRFDPEPEGPVWVYRMDKQKVSTLQALERISKDFSVRRRDLSVGGLKDKQGRTEQLVGVKGGALGASEVVQSGDLRLKLIGRTAQPISSANISANRFEVTVRDLAAAEAARVADSVAEVQRVGRARDGKRENRQPHADEHELTVTDLSRRDGDHHLLRRVVTHRRSRPVPKGDGGGS